MFVLGMVMGRGLRPNVKLLFPFIHRFCFQNVKKKKLLNKAKNKRASSRFGDTRNTSKVQARDANLPLKSMSCITQNSWWINADLGIYGYILITVLPRISKFQL